MARGNRNQTLPRKIVDLTNVLRPSEKDEFVALLHRITEKVGKQMGDSFDYPNTSAPCTRINSLISSLTNLKENVPSLASKSATAALKRESWPSRTVESVDRAKQQSATSETAASTTHLSELKKELLAFYKKWQTLLLTRLRDLHVNTLSDSSTNAVDVQSTNARGSRSGRGRSGRGSRGRSCPTTNNAPIRSSGSLKQPSLSPVNAQFPPRFKPTMTSLWELPMEKRMLLMHIGLLLVLSTEDYTAYARAVMIHLTSSLHVPLSALEENEIRVAGALGHIAALVSQDEALQLLAGEIRSQRRIKASANSCALSNFSSPEELAIQMVSHGLGTAPGGCKLGATVTIGLLGSVAEHGIVVGSLFGVFSAKLSGRLLETYTRDVPDFAYVPVRGKLQGELKDTRDIDAGDRRLRLVVAVNGWVEDKDDLRTPWKSLGEANEVFAVQWELGALMAMYSALESATKSLLWDRAKQDIRSGNFFTNLANDSWPLSLTRINKIIDNPWSVGMVRADKLGLILADTIQRRVHGGRPVTLIGFSLGARAIYSCLMALAERRHFGLIDSVVLIGTPVPSESRVWLTLKSVVAGRLINVYTPNDYMLGFLCRTSNIEFGVAGLQEVPGVPGMENFNIGPLPGGHFRYQHMVGTILLSLNWDDVDSNQVAHEHCILRSFDFKYERSNRLEALTQSFRATTLDESTSASSCASSFSSSPGTTEAHLSDSSLSSGSGASASRKHWRKNGKGHRDHDRQSTPMQSRKRNSAPSRGRRPGNDPYSSRCPAGTSTRQSGSRRQDTAAPKSYPIPARNRTAKTGQNTVPM